MRIFLLIFILTGSMNLSFGQMASHVSPRKKNSRPLTIYTCGYSEFEPDSCFLKTAKEYGFYSKDLGCFVNKKIQRKFNRNNKKVERSLEKAYGKGWKNNFRKDLELCRLKEDWGVK